MIPSLMITNIDPQHTAKAFKQRLDLLLQYSNHE
jgi:hypothetical protein